MILRTVSESSTIITVGTTGAAGTTATGPAPGPAAVRASGGTIVTVDDDAIVAARRRLAGEGVFVEPTAAVCFAAATAAGDLPAGDDVVVPLCGAGLKHPA